MNIRRVIQFVEYMNYFLLIGLFVPVFIVVMRTTDGRWFVLEMLVGLPFVLTFLFRNWIIHYFLRRCPYPGVFYSVADKLGLTHKIEITLTDVMLDEIYRPSYSTEQFISENYIKTGVAKSRKVWLPALILMFVGIFLFTYYDQSKSRNAVMLVLAIVHVVLGIYLLVADQFNANVTDILEVFQKDMLDLRHVKIAWKDLYDWDYIGGSEYDSERISLKFYDGSGTLRKYEMIPGDLNLNKVDILMLLTHFKGKYGGLARG